MKRSSFAVLHTERFGSFLACGLGASCTLAQTHQHHSCFIRGFTMRLRLIGLVSLLSLSLVQSVHAQSFNCQYARTPDEIVICNDARLSRLDERLSSRFYSLRDSLSGPDRVRLDQRQSAWLDSRHRCRSDRSCIAAAYLSRISELSGRPVASAVFERTCVRDVLGNQTCREISR